MLGRVCSLSNNHLQKTHASRSMPTSFCATRAHMARSLELGTSCPPLHRNTVKRFSSTKPSDKSTNGANGSLSPRTKRVGIWTSGFPARETSSLLRPAASNGGKGETKIRHLTLWERCRSAERTAAPPSECATTTFGSWVWMAEAMRSIAARTDGGELQSHKL